MVKTSNTFVEKHTVIEKLNPMTKVLAIFSLGLGTLIFPNSWLGLLVIIGLFIVAYIFDLLDFTEQKFRLRHIIYFFIIDLFFAGMFYSLVRTFGMFMTFGVLFLAQIFLKWVI